MTTPRTSIRSARRDRDAAGLRAGRDRIVREDEAHSAATYFGGVRLRGHPHYRRLDLKTCLPDEFAYALLSFTGSAYFNRSLRSLVKTMGYSLSEHGLTAAVADRPPGPLRPIDFLNLVPATTEQDIFAALGLDWVPPEKRSM